MMGFAACALILSSCAQNELLDGPQSPNNDGKIQFSAVSSLGSTRAVAGQPLESTAALRALGSFNVKGYGTTAPIAGLEYVNAQVDWKAATQSWEYSNEPFWPAQALDFYAYAPTTGFTGTAAINSPTHTTLPGVTVTDFTVGVNSTQVDLVVASALGKTKEERTPLLFKHALTQIVFKAMTVTNSKLNVEIDSVEIVNINNKGTFKSTATPATDYPQSYWAPATTSSYSKYSAAPATAFRIPTTANGVAGTTANAVAIKSGAQTNQLLMIPQNFNAWDTKTSILANDAGTKNAYIKLKAAIWTKVETTADVFKNVALHGKINADDENGIQYATIYIPVASLNATGNITQDGGNKTSAPLGQWVPGRRINYIITFGDTGSGSGGGGYTEDPTDPDLPPVQVLVPIKFTAEVEDWVDQDVPLLTASFSGTSNSVNATFIDGYTNNLLNDLKGAIVPKKYNAKITIGGTTAVASPINLGGYVEDNTAAVGSMYKYLPGTTITYDFTGLAGLSTTNTISATVPAGWVSTPAAVGGIVTITAADKIVLTRSEWMLTEIKASVEKRAASAVYTCSDAAVNTQNLGAWTPMYLAPNQTLSIDFPSVTSAPVINANWVWDGPNKRATYVQPYHAADIAGLKTLLEGTAIDGYTYYINTSATNTTVLSSITPNVSATNKKVYVVFKDGALTGSTLGTGWSISTADPKVAIYTKP